MIQLALSAFAAEAEFLYAHPSVDKALASPAANRKFKVVSVGSATELLDEVARLLRVRWWVRDGFLRMAGNGFPTDRIAVQLAPTHWLDSPTTDGSGIVHVTTFLDPTIVPGREVQLIGRKIPGIPEAFRCEAVTYSGDTRGGPSSAALTLRSFPGAAG